jgi:hypothetical protein
MQIMLKARDLQAETKSQPAGVRYDLYSAVNTTVHTAAVKSRYRGLISWQITGDTLANSVSEAAVLLCWACKHPIFKNREVAAWLVLPVQAQLPSYSGPKYGQKPWRGELGPRQGGHLPENHRQLIQPLGSNKPPPPAPRPGMHQHLRAQQQQQQQQQPAASSTSSSDVV